MIVNWTEAALDDLRAIEANIARRSPQYGRKMIEGILDRTEQLVDSRSWER
jgi:plasmid stabilization system protein ParE